MLENEKNLRKLATRKLDQFGSSLAANMAEDSADFPASFVPGQKGTPLFVDDHNHKYRIHSKNTDQTIPIYRCITALPQQDFGQGLPASAQTEYCERFCQLGAQGLHGYDDTHSH